jgi:CelD/BcsL family acetyltransferase involved in cellulose biosynthesis
MDFQVNYLGAEARMKITCISGKSLGSGHAAIWSNFQESDEALASPYFRPEFTQVVAGVRDDVFIGVLEDENGIAGFFPFQRSQRGIGTPVGGILSDYQGVIARSDLVYDAATLVRACGLKIWDFDHLLASQDAFARWHRRRDGSPVIDLAFGYEAYTQERRAAGSEQVKKSGNMMRRIEREVGPLRFEPHSADTAALAATLGWKSQQYLRSGKEDLFAHAWVREVLSGILTRQSEQFAGMFSLLYAGDRAIAGHVGMRSRTVWHYWFPAYDPEFERYSPGTILLLKMAQHAARLGVRAIDLGKGQSPYKQRLMSRQVPLAEGSVELLCWRAISRSVRRGARTLITRSPLIGPARYCARLLRAKPGSDSDV